jgi:sugar phosphate isomerase/epimerase
MALKLPPGFDWEALWATYVQTIRLCVEAAKAEGLRLSLEGHLHVMSPGTDSLLRLADHIGDDAFGFNMDIGWHALQREDIGWAIHKMGRLLLNVHIRDVDGFGLHFTAPGLGCLDWPGIVQALKSIGYQGALNLELSEYKDRERIAAWSFEYMRRVLAGEEDV